jgi:hypothetical protein
VAKLLNIRLLVINIGSNQGVTEGMEFDVLNRNAGEVVDPDTNQVLGVVVLRKLQVSITAVFDEFAVAEVKGGRGGGLFAPWLLGTEGASLKRSSNPEVEEIDEKDSIVKLGDEVVEVPKDSKAT